MKLVTKVLTFAAGFVAAFAAIATVIYINGEHVRVVVQNERLESENEMLGQMFGQTKAELDRLKQEISANTSLTDDPQSGKTAPPPDRPIVATRVPVIPPGRVTKSETTQIDWHHPWAEPGYAFEAFVAQEDGLQLAITETKGIYYGIQAFTESSLPLIEGRDYGISFTVVTNKGFPLFSRLGDYSIEKSYSFIDESFTVAGTGRDESFSRLFRASGDANHLYFQFGAADPGTFCKISGIRVRAT